MGSTVFANNMGISHKKSAAWSFFFPDICLTPTPDGPVPIPYPNLSLSADIAHGTKTIKIQGEMGTNKGCDYSRSTGDEAGSLGGIISGTYMDKAEFVLSSFDVKLEGKNACRTGDLMYHNRRNAIGGLNIDSIAQSASEVACDAQITSLSVRCGHEDRKFQLELNGNEKRDQRLIRIIADDPDEEYEKEHKGWQKGLDSERLIVKFDSEPGCTAGNSHCPGIVLEHVGSDGITRYDNNPAEIEISTGVDKFLFGWYYFFTNVFWPANNPEIYHVWVETCSGKSPAHAEVQAYPQVKWELTIDIGEIEEKAGKKPKKWFNPEFTLSAKVGRKKIAFSTKDETSDYQYSKYHTKRSRPFASLLKYLESIVQLLTEVAENGTKIFSTKHTLLKLAIHGSYSNKEAEESFDILKNFEFEIKLEPAYEYEAEFDILQFLIRKYSGGTASILKRILLAVTKSDEMPINLAVAAKGGGAVEGGFKFEMLDSAPKEAEGKIVGKLKFSVYSKAEFKMDIFTVIIVYKGEVGVKGGAVDDETVFSAALGGIWDKEGPSFLGYAIFHGAVLYAVGYSQFRFGWMRSKRVKQPGEKLPASRAGIDSSDEDKESIWIIKPYVFCDTRADDKPAPIADAIKK